MLDPRPAPDESAMGDLDATVYVASYNTAASTELCVRSARQHSDEAFELVVGDGGSTDGTVEALRPLSARGWVRVEHAPGGRLHAEWLDHFLAACETRWAVFLDSDIELLRDGWLTRLVGDCATAGAALGGPEVRWEGESTIEPVGGRRVQLAGRVAPWVMVVDVPAIRALEASFAFEAHEGADVPEGVIAYDVGAAVFRGARARALIVHRIEGYDHYYRHYGGISWIPIRGRRGLKKLRDQLHTRARLALLRRRQAGAWDRPAASSSA